MQELLATYSLMEIAMFIITLALAIKGLISFWDWAYDRLKKHFDKNYQNKDEKRELEERLQKGSDIMTALENNQAELTKAVTNISDKVDMLIDSDKDDIKSFLTKEHHFFCYQKGWIDDYSLECCEKRYQHYRDEGGNSFIEGFMKELRALPKTSNAANANTINRN